MSIIESLPNLSVGGELKLINQGTYGCIFHPGINCRGKKENANYLTKIMKNAKTIENEIAISKYIQQIKGYNRFFAPIIKQCPVKISQQYHREVKQCELFQNMEDDELKTHTYVSNKIRYVGDTNISKFILNQHSVAGFWKNLLESHIYLSKGADKLITQNIVHHDVKYNNIMIDKKINKPIFIDFGISIHIPSLSPSNLHNAFYVYDTYPYWCFEVCVCNYMFRVLTYSKAKTALITKSELESIVDTFIYGYDKDYAGESPIIKNDIFENSVFPFSSDNIITQFKEQVSKYYTPFIGKTWISLYDHFIHNGVYKTWDTYSLCVVYLFILDDYVRLQNKTFLEIQNVSKEQYNSYIKLLYTIIFSTPDERYSPQDMIKELKKIISQIASRL
jgi:serine/threonine protein kinase